MNELLIQLIKTVATIPIAWIILRLIFKRSVMFQFSMITVSFTLFVDAMKAVELLADITFLKYALTPANILIGVGVYIYINNLLKKPLERSIMQVNELSEGNLNIEIQKSESKNELGILSNSLLNLTNRLKTIISTITDNADNVLNASQQMSSSSEELSQGANEQASSIEEISSTMEEISANIQQNSQNAQQTYKISLEANDGIKEVAKRASNAVGANKEIAEKIGIVNDIAFQTNILALNAAVEAARAGEHGKGFAVVATEVRKLAERSKVAAEEIVALAQKSLELAEGAGEVMMRVLPKIENTTLLVQEISAASLEQSNGTIQVNNAIQQLNNVTQQNASSSEELASSAEELAAQAEELREAISFFSTASGENRENLKAKNKSEAISKL